MSQCSIFHFVSSALYRFPKLLQDYSNKNIKMFFNYKNGGRRKSFYTLNRGWIDMKAEFFFLITVLQNVKLYREQQQTGANLFWQCKQCLSVLKEQNTAMCHCCFGVLILFFFLFGNLMPWRYEEYYSSCTLEFSLTKIVLQMIFCLQKLLEAGHNSV